MSAPAAALMAEAAGVCLRVAGDGKVRAPAGLPAPLLARLRERKNELAGVLRGDDCRRCDRPMGWPDPVGVTLVDGTAMYHACRECAEVERVRRRAENCFTPEVLADEAEVTMPGKPPLRPGAVGQEGPSCVGGARQTRHPPPHPGERAGSPGAADHRSE